MVNHRLLMAAIVLTGTLAGGLGAQNWCLNGPNANFTINGQSAQAVDPVGHDIDVTVPGIMSLSITTGVNPLQAVIAGISLTSAAPELSIPDGGLPWDPLDSIDISAADVQLLGDGFNPVSNFDFFFVSDDGNPALGLDPEFRLAVNVNTNFDGLLIAFQNIVTDPSNMFGFDTTEAINVNFATGLTIDLATGADGVVQVPFSTGKTFEFHGLTYSDVYVCDNGFVSFGAATTVVNNGWDGDWVGLVGSEPFIAVHQSDWEAGILPGDPGVSYQQSGNTVSIVWGPPVAGGMAHFASTDFGNELTMTLQLQDPVNINPAVGSFDIASTVLVPTGAAFHAGVGLKGHGPGSAAIVAAADGDLNAAAISAFGESQTEEHFDALTTNSGGFGGVTPNIIGWDGAGAPRGYNNATTSWNGRTNSFAPTVPFVTAGDGGYTHTPDGAPQAEDIGRPYDLGTGVVMNSLDATGSQVVSFSGSFQQFLGNLGPQANQVVLDAAGTIGGPYDLAIIGVFDDSGTLAGQGVPMGSIITGMSGPGTSTRDMQGIQIVTPVLAGLSASGIDLTFTFDSGPVFATTVDFNSPGVISTPLSLGDDASVVHNLTVPVTFYGVSYTQISVCPNGIVNFGGTTGSFTNSALASFGGFNSGGVLPGVAPLWSDFNMAGEGAQSYRIVEDTNTNTVTVDFMGLVYWNTGILAGDVSVSFNAQITSIDYSGMAAAASAFTNTISYTDGDNTGAPGPGGEQNFSTGVAGSSGLEAQQGVYTTAMGMAPDSVAEDVLAGTDFSTLFGLTSGVLNIADIGDGVGTPFGTLTIF